MNRYKNEFPHFDDKANFDKLIERLAPLKFEDESWHNETMPHVAKAMPTEQWPDRAMRIWVDFADKDMSEWPREVDGEYYRFGVSIDGEYGDYDTKELDKDFKTYDEVIDFVEKYFEEAS